MECRPIHSISWWSLSSGLMIFSFIFMLMIPKFISSPDLSPESQTYVLSCPLNISAWMYSGHLKVSMFRSHPFPSQWMANLSFSCSGPGLENHPWHSPHLSLAAADPVGSYLQSGSGIRPLLTATSVNTLIHLSPDWAQWSLTAVPASHLALDSLVSTGWPFYNMGQIMSLSSWKLFRSLPIALGIRATVLMIRYRALRELALPLPLLPSLLLLPLGHSASATLPSLLFLVSSQLCALPSGLGLDVTLLVRPFRARSPVTVYPPALLYFSP